MCMRIARMVLVSLLLTGMVASSIFLSRWIQERGPPVQLVLGGGRVFCWPALGQSPFREA